MRTISLKTICFVIAISSVVSDTACYEAMLAVGQGQRPAGSELFKKLQELGLNPPQDDYCKDDQCTEPAHHPIMDNNFGERTDETQRTQAITNCKAVFHYWKNDVRVFAEAFQVLLNGGGVPDIEDTADYLQNLFGARYEKDLYRTSASVNVETLSITDPRPTITMVMTELLGPGEHLKSTFTKLLASLDGTMTAKNFFEADLNEHQNYDTAKVPTLKINPILNTFICGDETKTVKDDGLCAA